MALVNQHISNMMEVASLPPSPHDSEADELAEHIKLRTFVEQIISAQRGLSVHPERTAEEEYDELVDWLKQCGATVDKVAVDHFNGMGQGLKATAEAAPGETLLRIPEACMLSEESARRSTLGAYMDSDTMLKLMPNVTLAFHLLLELHDLDSFWRPYIACLPVSYSVPLYWDLPDLMSLRGSSLFVEAIRLYKHVCRQYGYLHNKLSEAGVPETLGLSPEAFTFEDWRWAVATVMTRQNSIPQAGPDGQMKPTLALIPLWDMINHANHPMSTQFDSERECLEFVCPAPAKPGSQITMWYGDRNNGQFLLHQGFFFAGHANDYVNVPFSLDETDSLYKIKALLLRNLTVPPAGDFVLSTDDQLDPQLLAFARVASMSKEEVEDHLRNPQKCQTLGAMEGGMVSRNNEFRALQLIRSKVATLLDAVPADPEAIGDSAAAQMAKQYVESERRIATHSVDQVDGLLAKLTAK